jgi:hypothetical protein
MSEVLFILTTIYVAYVVYRVTDQPKMERQANKPASVAVIMPSSSVSAVEIAAAPVTEPVAKAKKASSASSNALCHPETGEIAKVSNNYRGLKRWLKEALVTEGLLEKVYSNSELNDETNAKIRVALAAIKAMSKYHA